MALERVANGTARYVPQDEAAVTMCQRLTKEQGVIDWSLPAAELERHVRAMNPWPGARTQLADGRGLAVWRCHPLPTGAPEGALPGQLVRTEGRLVVACGTGLLELDDVQLEGKRPMDAAAFLNGTRLEAGTRLGAGVPEGSDDASTTNGKA